MKRTFDGETYQKIGRPDLTHIIYFRDKDGKKVWGRVSFLQYLKDDKVRLGIEPFKKKPK
jgi:hypothetical protein